MKNVIMALLALFMVLGVAVESRAHSVEGLERTTLVADQLTVNHVAYYLEAKVNGRIDEDGRKYRYTIWDFNMIERQGDMALVHVTINDQKDAKQYPETLYLKQNDDGTWTHVDENGAVIAASIYTMVKPDYTQYYVMGGSAVLLLIAGTLSFLKRRKQKTASQSA